MSIFEEECFSSFPTLQPHKHPRITCSSRYPGIERCIAGREGAVFTRSSAIVVHRHLLARIYLLARNNRHRNALRVGVGGATVGVAEVRTIMRLDIEAERTCGVGQKRNQPPLQLRKSERQVLHHQQLYLFQSLAELEERLCSVPPFSIP